MPLPDTPMDPVSRQTFARAIEALHEEFRDDIDLRVQQLLAELVSAGA